MLFQSRQSLTKEFSGKLKFLGQPSSVELPSMRMWKVHFAVHQFKYRFIMSWEDTHTWSTSEQTSHNTNSEHTPNYCFADISIENVYAMCMQLIRCVTSISKLEAHGLHLIDIISSSSPTHTQIRFTGQRMPIQLISSSALATHIWPQRHEYIAYTPQNRKLQHWNCCPSHSLGTIRKFEAKLPSIFFTQ